MNKQPDLQNAIDVVGPAEPDDWKIDPTGHAAEFNETAPTLANILSRAEVHRTARQYKRNDKQAVDAQKEFKRAASVASWGVAAAATAAALILCVGSFKDLFPKDSQFQNFVFAGVSSLAIALGAVATMWINRLRGGNLLERWLQSRAEAERRRLEFFESVINTDEAGVDADLDLLRLEYVRRFLLDSQLAYFEKRSREHRMDAEKTLDWASRATCAATVLAGLAGCLAVIDPHFAVLAALGVTATALATVAAQRETVNQDRRNAERYAATCTSLEELAKRLSTTREAIAGGDRAALVKFFEALREALLAEHAQWLEESKQKNAAIDKLDEILKSTPPKSTSDTTSPGE